MPADWELPTGVSRALWEYFHDPEIARAYDDGLGDAPLLRIDQAFVIEHCLPVGRIVDLGAGTGRLAITLAEHGYQPVAVDLSPEMLKVLADKSAARGLEIPCVCANLADLGVFPDGSFDHAACLFSTLGLIVGVEARRKALAETFRVLRPGGVFAFHVHNRWFNMWTAHGRRLLLAELLATLTGRGQAGDYEMPPHLGIGRLTMHLFTRGEIDRMLRESGFEIVEIRSISLAADGRLGWPWWFPRLRSYGYLVAARKPPAHRSPSPLP